MLNATKNKEHYGIILVLILLAVIPSFLLQDGLWLFLDSSYYPKSYDELMQLLYSSFHVFNVFDSHLGYENILGSFLRIGAIAYYFLVYAIFGLEYGQYFYLYSILLAIFFSSFKVLILFFNRNTAYLGAILYTINPVSLYFFTQFGFFLAYLSLPIIFYGLYNLIILGKNETKYLLYFLLGIFLQNYIRIILINFIILLSVFFYFMMKTKVYYSRILLIIASLLGVILVFGMSLSSSTGIDGNYAEHFKEFYGAGIYEWKATLPFYNIFEFREIYTNVSSGWQYNNMLYDISYLFLFSIILIACIQIKKEYRRVVGIIIGFFLFFSSIAVLQKFVTLETYLYITYDIFPFLANSTYWVFPFSIILYTLLLTYLFEISSRGIKGLLITGVVFNLITLTLPFIEAKYTSFYQVPDYTYNDIALDYNNNNNVVGSINLLNLEGFVWFNGSPYPINIALGNNKNFISNNPRSSAKKHQNLYNILYGIKEGVKLDIPGIGKDSFNFLSTNIVNSAYIGVKEITLPKNLKLSDFGNTFYYKNDITEIYKEYNNQLSSSTGLVRKETSHFDRFIIPQSDKFDYSIYSPSVIIEKDILGLFSELIDIRKPVFLEFPEYNRLINKIGIDNIAVNNQNISMHIKSSLLSPTKHYIKFSNIDSREPFITQLNQLFGTSWKVKWITKEEFEEKQCIDEYREYPITQNALCQYSPTILDLRDTKYLGSPNVSEEHHFEGNFVGNTWFITPDDIPEDMRGQSALYAVIIYEKQIYYTWALVISGLTFFVLILLTIRESVISYRQKKYDK